MLMRAESAHQPPHLQPDAGRGSDAHLPRTGRRVFFCPIRASSCHQTSMACCRFQEAAWLGSLPARWRNFFKILDGIAVLGVMAWTGRQLAEAQGLQFPPQRRLVQRDAEILENPLGQILEAPSDDAPDRHHSRRGQDGEEPNHQSPGEAVSRHPWQTSHCLPWWIISRLSRESPT